MELLKLFITALMPNLKVLLITALGAFLALERFNLLREDARRHLNALVYYVFTPALVCSILTETITFKSLIMLWFMPVNILLTFIFGTALGWLFLKTTTAPREMQGLVLGCCAAGNLGNMPIIIIPAVCKESGSPFGDVDVCDKKGMAYASLSMAIGNVYLWTFVYNLVHAYSCKSSIVSSVEVLNQAAPVETDPENHPKSSIGTLDSTEDTSETNDHKTQLEIERTAPNRREKVSKRTKMMKVLKILAKKLNLEVLLSPGTSGSFIGLILGVVAPFRKLLVGDNAPLRVIQDSTSLIGEACIPAVTLLVGANLIKGFKGSGMKVPLVILIIVVRFIALPIIGVGIIKGAVHFGMIHHDPLYQFTLLLQYALPPAISISTITQLFGTGETECSIIMLATNICSSVFLTVWSAFYMWLVL